MPDEAPLYVVVYVSSAQPHFTDAALGELLRQSREFNASHGITGVLLYHDGDVMQVLEGPPDEVRHLHARIAADPRHRSVMALHEGPATRRSFPDWRMAFGRSLAQAAAHALPSRPAIGGLSDAAVRISDAADRQRELDGPSPSRGHQGRQDTVGCPAITPTIRALLDSFQAR